MYKYLLSTPACRDGRHAVPSKLSVRLIFGEVNGLFRMVLTSFNPDSLAEMQVFS